MTKNLISAFVALACALRAEGQTFSANQVSGAFVNPDGDTVAPGDPPAAPVEPTPLPAPSPDDTDGDDADQPVTAFAFAAPDGPDGEPEDEPEDEPTDDAPFELKRRTPFATGFMVPVCGCTTVDDDDLEYDDVREISDFSLGDGVDTTMRDATNMVWAWGQLLDHDFIATIDQDKTDDAVKKYNIHIEKDGEKKIMVLERLEKKADGECHLPFQTITPQIDAGVVYGPDEDYLQNTLREPGSCKLRTAPGNLLPITTNPEEPTEEGGTPLFYMLAGDLRVNEHSVLTVGHTIWMREHNRICDVMSNSKKSILRDLSEDEKFERARKVVIAKFQKITFDEFLPAIGIQPYEVRHVHPRSMYPDISFEFGVAAYRFGHDMVPDMIGRWKTTQLFGGEQFFLKGRGAVGEYLGDANDKIDGIVYDAATTPANKVDGRLADTLRNELFGEFGQDLGSRNVFRGRDTGLKTYGEIAKCYGIKPDPEVAEDTPDAFVGLLKEPRRSNKLLGPTALEIIKEQLHRSVFGKGGYWWKDNIRAIRGFELEVFGTTYGKVINLNTKANVPNDVFRL